MGGFDAEIGVEHLRLPVALGILALAALDTLRRDFLGEEWRLPVFGAALIALATITVLRRAGLPGPMRAGVTVVGGVWFLSLAIVPEITRYGIPNVQRFFELIRTSWERTLETYSPVVPDSGFVLLAAAAAWSAVLVSEIAVEAGRPITGYIPWAAFFAFTSATGGFEGRRGAVITFLAGSFVYLFLTGAPGTEAPQKGRGALARMAPGAALLGSIAIIGAVVLPQFVPGYGSPAVVSWDFGPASRTEPSPLVQIRPRLTQSPEIALFDVRTTPPQPSGMTYWRLLALDRFDGGAWHSSAEYGPVRTLIRSAQPFRGESLPLSQRVRIRSLGGPWVPAAYQPVRVSGIRVSADPRGSALVVPRELRRNLTYEVESVIPNPSAELLRAAPSPNGLDEYQQLDHVSEAVRRIAQTLTQSEPTQYDKVIAISTHLRRFRYDENVAPGHSQDELLRFLTETRAGYCEQFAGSMAVLARAVGIPARVAVGFLPGNYDPESEVFHVTTEHAHAWPEIYFEGAGWVPFEPTPRDIALVPSYSIPPPAPAGEPEAAEPAAEDLPAGQQTIPEEDDPLARDPLPTQGRPVGVRLFVWAFGGLIGASLGTLALVAGAKLHRRSRRRRSTRPPAERVQGAFWELADRTVDLRRPRRGSETAAEFGAAVSIQYRLDAARTATLVEGFERSAYAPMPPDELTAQQAWEAFDHLLTQLRARTGLRGRMAMLISPRSLIGSARRR